MSDELKPCPFCGGLPSYQKTAFYGSEQSPSYVKCRRCNFYIAKTGTTSDEDVLMAWNTRPIEDELRAENERLQKLANYYEEHYGDSVRTGGALADTLSFHPRAAKLMSKRKNFVVVAEDEPYYLRVYAMIRGNEIPEGRWSEEDERLFQAALAAHIGLKEGEQ
jgi:Lar family restriction alleviation protein